MLIVIAQFVSWSTCAPWGDCLEVDWGSLPPISPSGLSFSVLLDIMHHKKEEAIISFGPKPRSSIIGTFLSLASILGSF